MRKVIRLVRALGAGAAMVWGLARSLRRGSAPEDGPAADPAPGWPPPPPAPDPGLPPELQPQQPSVPVDVDAIPTGQRLAVPLGDLAPVQLPAQPVVLKGVAVEDPAGLVALANQASDDTLRELGIKGKALSTLIEHRPYASPEALGDTPGVGRRTLQALVAGL